MHKFLTRVLIALTITLIASAKATALDSTYKASLRDSLGSRLESAKTPSDSLPILLDIYDLTYGKTRIPIAEEIYRTATNADNDNVRIEALQVIANLHNRNDSVLQLVLEELDKIEPSPSRKSAQLFTTLLRIDNMLVADPTEKQREKMLEFNRRFNTNPPEDAYDKAALLYALCRYLGTCTRGELLSKYVAKLEDTVESLNLPGGAVQRLIYNRVTRFYLDNEEFKKAVESNRQLLASIDSLEMNYARQGRHFRNAPMYRYNSYRMMLSSYPALSKEEVVDYYNKVLDLAEMEEIVDQNLKYYGRPTIFYNMAMGKYEEVKPMIKQLLEKDPKTPGKLQLYRMLHEAAHKTGDQKTIYESSEALNHMLDERYKNKRLESARELKLVYDMNELTHINAALELEKKKASLRTKTIIITLTSILLLLLAAIVFILIRQERRQKKLATVLRSNNDALRRERDDLKRTRAELIIMGEKAKQADKVKTDFINNMSHEVATPLKTISEYTQLIVDCIPEDKSRYLDRFATIIKLNVRMVLNLVNEVLDIASADHKNFTMDKQPSDVKSMCNLAVANVFDQQNSDSAVEFCFDQTSKDNLIINTDSQRVSQVLINLLDNAVKFTEEGKITLDYSVSEDGKTITFSVTDTGSGIPRGQEEVIFDRFRQLDISKPGCGLGLYVSRLIASHLGGSLTLDTDYRGGARFLFTIPV